jgi:hypothetical protein
MSTTVNRYDIGVIGAGVAGAFAALRITQHSDASAIVFDLGRPPGKRRRQLEGWLGCFPSSDGKLYTGDLDRVLNVVDGRKARPAHKWAMEVFGKANPMKHIKDSLPNAAMQKRIKESGFDIQTNDHIQWKPDSIHQLSRVISEETELSKKLDFSFDNEVHKIIKKKSLFHIYTADGEYVCKKLILCVGRSGWRWANKLYKDLGMVVHDDYARFGIRIEIAGQYIKELNKSHCTLSADKNGDFDEGLEVGPFSWNGTVIPEDHADLVISSFRSNEDRWKSDKVSFSLTSSRYFDGAGCHQTDRLGKLAFILFNDRVSRERIKMILKGHSELCLLQEYQSWLPQAIERLDKIIPNLSTRGYYYAPNIIPMASPIRLGSNLESEVDGLFVAGESAGLRGILSAAITGCVAADSACK